MGDWNNLEESDHRGSTVVLPAEGEAAGSFVEEHDLGLFATE